MTRKAAASSPAWDDEDLPEWTDDQLDRAELAVGGEVVWPANGTLTRTGRPPLGAAAKQQVTLRLDADVLANFPREWAGVAGAHQCGVAGSDGALGSWRERCVCPARL